MNGSPGIATVTTWTMAPDGETYLHFWGKWKAYGDREAAELFGIQKIRSQEGFFLVGFDAKDVPQLLLPGCAVKGIARCDQAPRRQTCYSLDS